MKKSKLSITLVTSFIAAMALSACNSVTASKKAVVTFTPYGSKDQIGLITDDVYKEYNNSSAGISKLYEKVLELLIRYKFKKQGFDKGDLKYSEIETWAKNQVKEQKDNAKASAKANGTSYDTEWDAILDSNNVENEKQLREKFIYEKEKEVITNWYADNPENAEALKDEFIGLDADGNLVNDGEDDVKSAFPYHIRHILVKVEEASEAKEKFYKGTIDKAQATRLYNVVTELAKGVDNFATIAADYSEDGSASSGGDVGIMTNDASSGSLGMVNEFQLGLYAYDNLYDDAKNNDELAPVIKDQLGFNSVVGEKEVDDGHGNMVKVDATAEDLLPNDVVEIPYEVFVKLGEYADVTADKYGNKLANGSTMVYPRNVLWNKYLNLHNVFVITKNKLGDPTFDSDPVNNPVANPNEEFSHLTGGDYNDPYISADRFNANGYLVDEKGNVIVGVRSQYGIHFMVIQRSMHELTKTSKKKDGTDETVTLAEYYSTALKDDAGFKENSYVGYIDSQKTEDYKKRADDIKSKIKSFDATYDYRLYSWLSDQTNIQFTYADEDLGLQEKIESYITNQKLSNRSNQEEGLQKVWKTYTRMIEAQQYNRDEANWITVNPLDGTPSPKLTRLASEQIATDFYSLYTYKDSDGNDLTQGELEDLYKKFAEGGLYYYYA